MWLLLETCSPESVLGVREEKMVSREDWYGGVLLSQEGTLGWQWEINGI